MFNVVVVPFIVRSPVTKRSPPTVRLPPRLEGALPIEFIARLEGFELLTSIKTPVLIVPVLDRVAE